MSETTAKVTRLEPRAQHVIWQGLAANAAGEPFALHDGPDRSVQVTGTFGGASIVWEGSNSLNQANAAWFTLTDPHGNLLIFATARLEQVTEYTRWVRPRVQGGDGSTSMSVILFVGT